MSTRAIDPSTLKFAKTLVRIKAKQLLRVIRDAATSSQQDLEQDLLLEVVVRWPGFDPNRGNAEAFVESVVQPAFKMLRDAKRAKRVQGPTVTARTAATRSIPPMISASCASAWTSRLSLASSTP